MNERVLVRYFVEIALCGMESSVFVDIAYRLWRTETCRIVGARNATDHSLLSNVGGAAAATCTVPLPLRESHESLDFFVSSKRVFSQISFYVIKLTVYHNH